MKTRLETCTLTTKYSGISSQTPQVRLESLIYIPKRDEEHLRPFHKGISVGIGVVNNKGNQ